MATVIQLPQDKRFGDLGQGLGNVLTGITEEQKKQRRQAAIQKALDLTEGEEDTSRAALMATLGPDFEVAEKIQLADSLMTQQDERRRLAIQKELSTFENEQDVARQEDQQKHEVGLESSRQRHQTDLSISDQNLQRELEQSRQAHEDARQKERLSAESTRQERDISANKEANERRIQAQRDLTEEERNFQLGLGDEVTNTPGVKEALAKRDYGGAASAILQSKIPLKEKSDLIQQLLRLQESIEGAKAASAGTPKERTTKVTLPDGSEREIIRNPDETFDDALKRKKASKEIPEGAKLGTADEGTRTVNSVLAATGLDAENPEHRARAKRIVDAAPQVRQQLNNIYGLRTDEQGLLVRLSGQGEIPILKHSLALAQVENIMAADPSEGGTTLVGEVANQAAEKAEKSFRALEWVPEDIRSGRPDQILAYAADQRGFRRPDIRELGQMVGLSANQVEAWMAVKFDGMKPDEARKMFLDKVE